MLIDSHAHLFYENYKGDRAEVLRRALDAGVEGIVVPGTTVETSEESIELSELNPIVFAAVGFHPHEASKATEEGLKRVEEMSHQARVVAIGEIGLDYYYDLSSPDQQRTVFRRQIEIAVERNLPIIVHTRDSVDEAIRIVREAVNRNSAWCAKGHEEPKRGVFHCFTGTAGQATELFELGFTVSYPGIVTFKNSPVLATLKEIGYSNILIETDSPYLTPVPHRGKRNEPAYVKLVAEKIAEVFSVPVETIAETTSRNAQILFGLKKEIEARA
ncbi:MAG TPA: TatD family hydrolase [Bacteroidota bacterium]|nr:TatD family hydrolase [Bacteroidota bacterium]